MFQVQNDWLSFCGKHGFRGRVSNAPAVRPGGMRASSSASGLTPTVNDPLSRSATSTFCVELSEPLWFRSVLPDPSIPTSSWPVEVGPRHKKHQPPLRPLHRAAASAPRLRLHQRVRLAWCSGSRNPVPETRFSAQRLQKPRPLCSCFGESVAPGGLAPGAGALGPEGPGVTSRVHSGPRVQQLKVHRAGASGQQGRGPGSPLSLR